jgi:DDE superfamily endonuclease.
MPGAPSHLFRDTLLLARENSIDFLMFPPHTVHVLQPLGVRVFGLLKKVILDEYTKLMQKNKKNCLSRYDFCRVPTPVWEKAVTPTNILGGFQGSGMWPLDPAAVHLISDNGSSISDVILGDISDVEPGPGCSSYSNKIPTISEVVQVIIELLKPEENTTEHSRLLAAARCVTSGDEFCQGMKEKNKNKSKEKESGGKF